MYVDINFKLPEKLLLALRQSKDDFLLEMRKAVVVKYFIKKRLSLKKCAQLADIDTSEFIKYLSTLSIGIINLDYDYQKI